MLFNCQVKDVTTQTRGKIQALVVQKKVDKSTYFEKLTLYMEEPKEEKYILVNLNVDDKREEIYPKDTPRGTQRSRSADRDTHSEH